MARLPFIRPALVVGLACLVPLAATGQVVEEEIEGGGVFIPETVEEVAAEGAAVTSFTAESATSDSATSDSAIADSATSTPATREHALSPARPAPEPLRFTLDNGLRVVLLPLPGRRFAGFAVTYGVGSGSVPRGWTGLAHLTEHLMFAGTDLLDEVEVYLRLEAAGAVERNGETGPDRSVFYEQLPVSELGWALHLESERMARMLAGLGEARLERQRQVVLHEGWERGVYGWRGSLTQNLYRGVFGDDHPYAQVVEREGDVMAIRLPHVQWFFQQHYAPDNATITVVGGFDPAVLRSEIERYFGPIQRSAPHVPSPSDEASAEVSPLDHERLITVEIQDDRDQLYVAWPTPALYHEGDAALDVLSTLLYERREAPIRAALTESGLALDVLVRQRSHALGSVFVIHAIPSPGHTTDELRDAIDQVMAQVRREGFTDEEVRAAASLWARRMRLSAEELAARAVLLGTGTDDYLPTIEAERERYLAVDAAAVRRVVDGFLPARHRLLLTARANPRAGAEGRVLQDGQIDRPR